MSLAGKLAFQVDRGAQFRGSELFQSGAVQVTAVEPEHVHATVAGGQQYEVCVQFFNQELLVSCECEYFRDRGACKHIWAVILEADRRGALPGATALRRLSLLETTAERKGDHPGLVQTRRTAVPKAFVPPPPPPPPPPAWQTELTAIQSELAPAALRPATWPAQFELIYVADTSSSRSSGGIVLEVKMRTRKKTGDWSAPKEFKLAAGQLELVPDPEDAQLLTMLVGGVETYSYSYAQSFSFNLRKTLPGPLALRLLPRIAATGRLFATENSGYSTNLEPLGWDDGEAWRLWLEVRQDDRDQWKITGSLRRGEERMPLDRAGPAAFERAAAGAGQAGALRARRRFRLGKPVAAAESHRVLRPRARRGAGQAAGFAGAVPPMEIDEPLRFAERHVTPGLGLRITEKRDWNGTHFEGVLLFDYGRGFVEEEEASRGLWSAEERVYIVRDTEAESQARNVLLAAGLKPEGFGMSWRFVPRILPRVVRELVQAGWHVEAEGKKFRQPGQTRVEVSSGIDWFDLHAEVDYDGVSASLPQLLGALRRGDTMVRLGDGSFGLLPEDWLARFAPLAGLGTGEHGEEHLRLAPTRRDCWTRCWRRSRKCAWTRCLSACANGCATSVAFARRNSRPVSWANCAATSARGWAGWSFCANSASAAAWRTIWGWGRRRRCWRCWRTGVRRPKGRPWWWRRNR